MVVVLVEIINQAFHAGYFQYQKVLGNHQYLHLELAFWHRAPYRANGFDRGVAGIKLQSIERFEVTGIDISHLVLPDTWNRAWPDVIVC